MTNIKGTALVTGASSGIGEACALRLAAEGWHVFAGYRSDADGRRLEGAGTRITPVRLDVTQAADIADVTRTTADATGEKGLDAIVNNAGIAVAGPLEYLPLDAFRRQLDVNVTGVLALTQAVLPMLRRARGRIVLIGSISGRNALPLVGAYAASKFALEAMTDALRLELQPAGIHVTIIEPGVIATPIWDRSLALGDESLADAPPELHEHYGALLEAVRRRARRGVNGLPAERVADAVLHALTAKRPPTRKLIGRDARIRALLQVLLPDRVRDALVRRALRRL